MGVAATLPEFSERTLRLIIRRTLRLIIRRKTEKQLALMAVLFSSQNNLEKFRRAV